MPPSPIPCAVAVLSTPSPPDSYEHPWTSNGTISRFEIRSTVTALIQSMRSAVSNIDMPVGELAQSERGNHI